MLGNNEAPEVNSGVQISAADLRDPSSERSSLDGAYRTSKVAGNITKQSPKQGTQSLVPPLAFGILPVLSGVSHNLCTGFVGNTFFLCKCHCISLRVLKLGVKVMGKVTQNFLQVPLRCLSRCLFRGLSGRGKPCRDNVAEISKAHLT